MIAVLLAAWLLALPLLSVETAHFNFEHEAQGERLASHLAGRAEEIYAGLSRDLGVRAPGRITVRVAATPEQFRAMQPATPAEWARATAYPARRLIVIQGWGDTRPETTLAHELCHIMLQGALRGRPAPAWLAEGLAMHYGGQWELERWATLSQALLFGSLIPLSELTYGFPRQTSRARLAYAQSHSLVDYIRGQWGEDGLRRLTHSLAAGEDPERALQSATGLSGAELERRWVKSLKLRFSWVPIITSTAALWAALTALSLYVWRRKRAAARERLRRWEEEEAAEEKGPGGTPGHF